MTPTEVLIQELLALPGVEEAEGDMMGERSFRINGREFMHLHGTSLLHIGLTHEQKATVLAAGEARPHPYAPNSGAVELHLRTEAQLPTARHLVTLARERVSVLAARFPARAKAAS